MPAERIAEALDGLKVVVVGGGGIGNGRAIGRAVAAAGAEVLIVDRSLERTHEAVDEIVSAGGHAVGMCADVTDGDDIRRIIEACDTNLGGLDVLIPVVGGYTLFAERAKTGDTGDALWDRIIDLNLRYVFRLVRTAIPVFRRQARGGTIVGVGSIAGVVSSPGSAAYGAAKAALLNLARSVTLEYARDGIRMNVVSCGMIATEPAIAAFGEDYSERTTKIPMGRAGRPEEVANAVVFFASPLSSYIGGQSLLVDGAVTTRFPLPLPNVEQYAAG